MATMGVFIYLDDSIHTMRAQASVRRTTSPRVITKGEIFLMNPAPPASLDERYFGTLPLLSIIGRAVPF